jgi:hypothetical protein
MSEKLIITNTEIIAATPLDANIDVDKYRSVIEECQIFTIERILGTKLYKKIQTDYPDSLTGHYATIHERYLIPIIAHSVAADHIIIAAYQVKNGGVSKHLGQNSEPASKSEISFLSENQASKAQAYIERLDKFLCDKGSEIDEYNGTQENNYDQRPNHNVDNTGGWKLDGPTWSTGSNIEREIWKDILHDEGGR